MLRKSAKEILAESFRELALTMPVDKIRVQDIVNNCGYSTATFYRQFKDKYDLMAWGYAQECYSFIVLEQDGKMDWEKTIQNLASHFQEQKLFIQNLVSNTSGQDSFMRHMTEAHCNIMRKCILNSPLIDEIDEMTDTYIRIYCLGTTFFSVEWFYGKHNLTAQELAEVYKTSLPIPLRKYFDLE